MLKEYIENNDKYFTLREIAINPPFMLSLQWLYRAEWQNKCGVGKEALDAHFKMLTWHYLYVTREKREKNPSHKAGSVG